MTKIRFELAPKPSKAEKAAQARSIWICPSGNPLGEASGQIPGWNAVKVWSKTLNERLLMPQPNSIFASSDSCSSGWLMNRSQMGSIFTRNSRSNQRAQRHRSKHIKFVSYSESLKIKTKKKL
jgi:hypothetical protein